MKKRIFSSMLVLLLVLLTPLHCLAAGVEAYDYSKFQPTERIYNIGNYPITPEERSSFQQAAMDIEGKYDVTVAFILLDDLNGDVKEFSDRVFLQSPLGAVYNENFALLAIDMTGREVDLYTHGTAQEAISDTDVDYILDEIALVHLQDQSYGQLALAYVGEVEQLLGDLTYGWVKGLLYILLFAMAIAAIITLIFIAVQSAKHRPVKTATSASEYMKQGSLVLTNNEDAFLRTITRKTAIPKSSNGTGSSGSSSSGGGTSHSHSSGHSHGGGSRKF